MTGVRGIVEGFDMTNVCIMEAKDAVSIPWINASRKVVRDVGRAIVRF